jgi:2-dehydro-3-deoxygalactonokinase
MFPRFLDTLLQTEWYERKLFTESLIAAEDMIPLAQVSEMSPSSRSRFVLVGNSRRCKIYEQLLRSYAGSATQVTSISREEEIDQLSIRGIIHLAKTAGLFQ